MATVLYAQRAQPDRLEARLFVAENNLAAADKLLDTIEREAKSLALLTCPLVPWASRTP